MKLPETGFTGNFLKSAELSRADAELNTKDCNKILNNACYLRITYIPFIKDYNHIMMQISL